MICGDLGPAPQTICARVYLSLFINNKFGASYAVYALLAVSKATTESLSSHPDQLLRIVINTKMPKI